MKIIKPHGHENQVITKLKMIKTTKITEIDVTLHTRRSHNLDKS